MSLAENLLNTLPDDNDNTTRISNAAEEPHITVNEDRTITIPKELRTIAVVGDKNVETVTFDCVRYWDGHDLSTFAIYLNYTLPNGVTGTYIPTGIRRSADYYSFDWTIDRIMTEVAGSLKIALSAIQTDSNGAVQRQWGSLPNSDMVIAHGLPISNIPDVEEETDILSQALSELIEAKNLIGDINSALDAIIAIQEELIGGGDPEPVPSEGLAFTAIDGGYEVSGIGTCEDTDIVIPSRYNNLPVTGIGRDAFKDYSSLTSIYIPNSVTSIGYDAFIYCHSLESITLPKSVTSIGYDAFFDCTSLTDICVPWSEGEISGAPWGAPNATIHYNSEV